MRRKELSIESTALLGIEYHICDGVTIRQPSLLDVIEYGESAYYNTIGYLTCIPSDCKAALDDIGLDWCQLSDFDMFVLSTHSLTPDDTWLFLGEDLDFSKLELYINDDGDKQLRSTDGKIVIDDAARAKLSAYLCYAHGIVKKPEFPANEMARMMLLEESREAMRTPTEHLDQSMLPRLISYVANAPGSKYDYDACLKLRFSTFMDSVRRLQVISNAEALRNACYGGMIDTSKIDKNELDMLRDMSANKQRSVVRGV